MTPEAAARGSLPAALVGGAALARGSCLMPLSAHAAKAAGLKADGNTAFKNGENEKAARYYTSALELCTEPADRAVLHSNRAAARLRQGADSLQRALADAQQAVHLDPKSAKAHFRHGQVLRKLQRPSEAVAALQRMLELAPGDTAGKEELRLATIESQRQPKKVA